MSQSELSAKAAHLLERAMELTPDDRAILASLLMAHVDSESAPIPEWHKAELAKALAEYEADPSSAVPAEDVFREMDEVLKRRRAARA